MEELDQDALIKTNHQEAINIAFDWYVVQRQPFSRSEASVTPFTGRYRGDNGTKCPIGLLITDEEYTPEMEGRAPLMLPTDNPMRFMIDYNLEFLFELLGVHDKCLPLQLKGEDKEARVKFERLLGDFALEWGLIMPFSLTERG